MNKRIGGRYTGKKRTAGSLLGKLRNNRGFTLVEMLAAVVVLILLSLMLNTGLQMSLNSYHTMTEESETDLLLSTIVDALSGELRFARDVRTEEQTDGSETHQVLKDYTSGSFGRRTELSVEEDGQIYASGKRLIATGAYGNGTYTVTALDIYYADSVFRVHIEVTGKTGIQAETDASVRCLNGFDTGG